MKTVTVTFSASGYVKIEASIPDDMTAAQFEEKLNEGDCLVSICPDAPVMECKDGEFKDIGKVIELVEPNLEYMDFCVSEIPLSTEDQVAEDYKTQKRISD